MIKFCEFKGEIVACDENTIQMYSLQPVYECMEEEYENAGSVYHIENGQVILGISDEEVLEELRDRREFECFPIINRGQLWYNTLTTEQIEELNDWYQAWLDVTETKIVPEKPSWLK